MQKILQGKWLSCLSNLILDFSLLKGLRSIEFREHSAMRNRNGVAPNEAAG